METHLEKRRRVRTSEAYEAHELFVYWLKRNGYEICKISGDSYEPSIDKADMLSLVDAFFGIDVEKAELELLHRLRGLRESQGTDVSRP